MTDQIDHNDPERLIVEEARSGDADAFTILFDRYAPRIFSTCFQYTGHRQDAEDCVQETFIKAWRALNQYQFQSAFYTWLYRIAANTCLDYRRKAHRTPAISLDESVDVSDSSVQWQIPDDRPLPDETAESAELRRLIHSQLLILPTSMRQIITLIDIDGFSYQEVSEILEISIGTVKSRLSRARQRLMKLLKQMESKQLEQVNSAIRQKNRNQDN